MLTRIHGTVQAEMLAGADGCCPQDTILCTALFKKEMAYINGSTSFVQLWIADEEKLHVVVELDVPELLRLEGERLDG